MSSVHEMCEDEANLVDLPQYFADNPNEIDALNEQGETAIFSATRCGSLALLNYLLKCGANLQHQNSNGTLRSLKYKH